MEKLLVLVAIQLIISCDLARKDNVDPVQKQPIKAVAVLEEKTSYDTKTQLQQTVADFSMAFIKKSATAQNLGRLLVPGRDSRKRRDAGCSR